MKLIRVVRLIRLMKLMRLFKLTSFINSLEDRLNLNPATFKMITLIFKILFISHLLSCFWYFTAVPVCGDTPETPPGDPCPTDMTKATTNWVRYFGVDHLNLVSKYIA